MDLDRLTPFDFKRLSSDEDVVLVHAKAWENQQDERLLAYGEVRSLEQAPGDPYHLPDVERVFHSAVRAMQSARAEIDPRKRLHWNRITIIIVPTIKVPLTELKYTKHLIPGAETGIETGHASTFCTGGDARTQWNLMDLTVTPELGAGNSLTS